jgi:hypothetical protein
MGRWTRLPLLLVAVACGGNDSVGPGGPGPTPPVPGVIGISVASPNGDDGAMLFSVTGSIQSVAAAGGYQVLSYAPGASVTKVMVVGDIVSGPVLSLSVADKAKALVVTLEQVAARGTYVQRAIAGYQVTSVR